MYPNLITIVESKQKVVENHPLQLATPNFLNKKILFSKKESLQLLKNQIFEHLIVF